MLNVFYFNQTNTNKIMEKNSIKISSQFGHEVMAVNFAKALGLPVVIVPNKDSKEEFKAESQKIYDNMSFFYDDIYMVPFEEKDKYADAWDIIGELKAGTLDSALWNHFAASKLQPVIENLPEYADLWNKANVLIIPQKLISDGACGVTAAQQSLPLEVFNFMKNRPENKVLGQHFHKVNDLPTVENLAREFNLYVPGMSENPEVFGIRGVQHKKYYNMYASLNASVGIAGTHTWLLLTLFPEIPQVILFNKNGVENWKDIEAAYQALGFRIYCIGFDENTDMAALSEEIEETFTKLLA